MMNLFFPPAQRITRKQFWFAQLGYYAIYAIAALVLYILAQFIPNQSADPGTFSVSGANSIPFAVVSLAAGLFCFVSGLMVAIKRLHDRDRSGFFLFIALIPLIGGIWLVIELGFLAGTPGANRFGPSRVFGDLDAFDAPSATPVGYAPVNAPARSPSR